MPPLSFLSFSLSRSFLPIARRDDTLPAGDKGFRARGRAKLEMLIPGHSGERNGRRKGWSRRELRDSLNFVIHSDADLGTGDRRGAVSPTTRRLRWHEMLLLLLLLLLLLVLQLVACDQFCHEARGVCDSIHERVSEKTPLAAITVWNCCLLAAGRPLQTIARLAWWIYGAEILLWPRAWPVRTCSWFFRGCML